jgi:hypothetical protein
MKSLTRIFFLTGSMAFDIIFSVHSSIGIIKCNLLLNTVEDVLYMFLGEGIMLGFLLLFLSCCLLQYSIRSKWSGFGGM